MRLRELTKLVQQQLASAGGGAPDYAQRTNRKTTSDPLNPAGDDAAVLGMLALPNGTTFIASKFPTKATLVEIEVLLSITGGGYASCIPVIHDPANVGPTTQTLDKAYASAADGGFMSALSFVLPAGWEYTLQLETDGASGSSFSLQHLHETPLS